MTYKLFLIFIVVWFLIFEYFVLGMSLISLKSLISFFAVLLLRKRYSHGFNISHDSIFFAYLLSDRILIMTFSRCYHLFVCYSNISDFNIFVKNYLLLFYVIYNSLCRSIRKQPRRDFLLNRLNLLFSI